MDKRKGFLNISVSIGFKLLTTIIVIVVKRFLIQFCGNETNGLNSLYLSIIGFLSVAELGIGSAITFCMYKPIVEGQTEKVAALYHLFNRIYITVGTLVLVCGLVLTPFIPSLAKDYDQLNINLYTTFLLMLISVVLTYGYGAKTALIVAHKNNFITTAISSSCSILQYVLQIVVLFSTKSFEAYLLCRIFSESIQWIVIEIIVHNKYNAIIVSRKNKIDINTKKELIKNVKAMFIHKIGTLLVNTVDSLVISIFIGVISLGEYSNYTTIKSSMVAIISLVFSSITSVLGHMYVEATKEVSKKYCEFFHMLNFILGIVFFLGYYAVIDSLVSIFFSADLVVSKSISFVITMNGFVQFMRSSVLVFRDATGTFYYDRWKPLVEGIINIILSIIFVSWWGVVGVIIATIITNLFICHIVEPYVLYKHAFFVSPKRYYIRNYSMILFFFIDLIVLNWFMRTMENPFIELLLNGVMSLCISIPSCFFIVLLNWKNMRQVFKEVFKRRTS